MPPNLFGGCLQAEEFEFLKRNKWEFLLPTEKEQQSIIKKFKVLLSKKNFDLYLNNPIIYDRSCAYVTEFFGKYVNIYVTSKELVTELLDEIKERISLDAISYLVFLGKYRHNNEMFELRVGAYGVPCSKLAKVTID